VEGESQSGRRTEGLQLRNTWRIVWRWLLRLIVVAAFVAAVAVFYSLLQQAGVFDGDTLSAEPRFEDVPRESAFYGPIEEVVDRGIMTGFTNDLFAPRDAINRGQFSTVLVRAMEWRVSADETQPFGDVEDRPGVLDTADHIAVIYQRGIMTGRPGEPPTFGPEDPMTLEHAIVASVRAGGDDLQSPITPDPAIEQGPFSPALREALQVAQMNGLLTGLRVELEETDFGRPIERQQMAALMVNLRRALRL
jgi:hypothetical protein